MKEGSEIGGVFIPYVVVERFYAKVEVKEWSECWWWTGAKDRKGYGQFTSPLTKSQATKAHRFSYWVIRGPFFDEEEPDHTCRNTECVNPYHLEIVSKKENTARGNRARKQMKPTGLSLEDLLSET